MLRHAIRNIGQYFLNTSNPFQNLDTLLNASATLFYRISGYHNCVAQTTTDAENVGHFPRESPMHDSRAFLRERHTTVLRIARRNPQVSEC